MDVPYVWANYGAVPEEVYTGLQYGEDKHVHGELDAVLTAYVKEIAKKPNRKLSTAWIKGFEGILDAYLGEVPATFVYKGKTYTPKSYAESLPILTTRLSQWRCLTTGSVRNTIMCLSTS